MANQFRNQFAAVAKLSDKEIKLDEAALLIAAQMQDNIDVDYYLSLIENLTNKFQYLHEKSNHVSVVLRTSSSSDRQSLP